MYSDWTKEELIEEIKRLTMRVEELEFENADLYDENCYLQVELEEREGF